MTPVEVYLHLEEASKRDITMAWTQAMLNGLAKTKKFPKRPDELFAKPMKKAGPSQPMTAKSILDLFRSAQGVKDRRRRKS